MQQSVTRLAALTVPLATPPAAIQAPLPVSPAVSMAVYELATATLIGVQSAGTGMLTGEAQVVSGEREAAPAHLPWGVPHVHALHARVSMKLVPIVVLLM
jgi:hypothetical protein